MTTKKSAQFDRFEEAARQLGCDEDEKAFDEKLKVIAKPKTKGPSLQPPKKRGKE